MVHGVVKGVRPAGHCVLASIVSGNTPQRHARVISEAIFTQSPEHRVAADGQEGGSHSSDVVGVDAGKPREDLSLAKHLCKSPDRHDYSFTLNVFTSDYL